MAPPELRGAGSTSHPRHERNVAFGLQRHATPWMWQPWRGPLWNVTFCKTVPSQNLPRKTQTPLTPQTLQEWPRQSFVALAPPHILVMSETSRLASNVTQRPGCGSPGEALFGTLRWAKRCPLQTSLPRPRALLHVIPTPHHARIDHALTCLFSCVITLVSITDPRTSLYYE